MQAARRVEVDRRRDEQGHEAHHQPLPLADLARADGAAEEVVAVVRDEVDDHDEDHAEQAADGGGGGGGGGGTQTDTDSFNL